MKFLVAVVIALVLVFGYGQYRRRVAEAEKARMAFVKDSTARADSIKAAEEEAAAQVAATPASQPTRPSSSFSAADNQRLNADPGRITIPRQTPKTVTRAPAPTNRRP